MATLRAKSVARKTVPPVKKGVAALRPEDRPRYDHLITEDNTPVESLLAEAHYRLLVATLYDSWEGPPQAQGQFLAAANVGVFNTDLEPLPPVCPDMLLSLGVKAPRNLLKKENRSYFIWRFGKPPDVTIEIVSDTAGGEDTTKLAHYAAIKVSYYVIFDPLDKLKKGVLRVYALERGTYKLMQEPYFFPEAGLGLKLWHGTIEGKEATWLRWCDAHGKLIPTGKERAEQEKRRAVKARQQTRQEKQRAEQEKQRAEQEKQRAEQEKQRAEQEKQRAEQEKQRAEQEKQRAEQEKQRAEQEKQRAQAAEEKAKRLAARLRKLGVDPETA